MAIPRSLLAELAARAQRAASKVPWDPYAFAGRHAEQLKFVLDRSPFTHVMCARQSGKTWGDDFVLGHNADEHPGSMGLFLGLKGTGVRVSNWDPIWKKGLCEKHGVPSDWHNETSMLTRWDNGSRVLFAGTDDLSNIKKYLGNSLRNFGLVIIDECQDQPDETLRYILKTLLPPMLGPKSRVILSGVLPDVPAGRFLEIAHPEALEGRPCDCRDWKHFEWGRSSNAWTPEAMDHLRTMLEAHNLTEEDPQVQRDYFMRRVWNLSATAYRYRDEINGYNPKVPAWFHGVDWESGHAMAAVPLPGIDTFGFGIDPGNGDRASVVGWGWGSRTHVVQHVFEWVTDRNTYVPLSMLASTIGVAAEHYPSDAIFWDPGAGKMEIDTFGADYGVPLIRAATKADLKGSIRRMNDLLTKGWVKAMRGSKLVEDYVKARRDPTSTAGAWKWSSQWHPDPSESGRYGLQGYWDDYQEPEKPKSYEQQRREQWAQRQREELALRAGVMLPEMEEAHLFDGDEDALGVIDG